MTNPEIGSTEFWTAQELTLGAIWLQKFEEGMKLIMELWNLFRNGSWVKASSKSCSTTLV
jgi:hypothetical protein